MEINKQNRKFYWIYKIGFFVIFALPLLTLQPWLYPPDWGKTIIFRSIMAVLLFLFFWQFFYRKNQLNLPDPKAAPKKNLIFWAFAAFFLAYLLACIFSVDINFSLWGSPYRSGGFINLTFYFIFALLLFFTIKNSDWKKFWNFSIFIGILVCFLALIQFYGLFSNIFVSVNSRPSSTIGNPIFLGIYLQMLLFLAVAFLFTEKHKYLKIFYAFSVLIFLYVILITGSRASYLGVVIGGICFFLLYPKKFKTLKIAAAVFAVLILASVFYANLVPDPPKIISSNRIIGQLYGRLSIKNALNDERYRAWQTVVEEIKDRPILGWGPENLAVGFDKNYNPLVTPSPWWDKAHNVFLGIGAEAGILGILAYIFLFGALFWQLHKTKQKTDEDTKIIITGLQATLIGYPIANLFSFDCFSTYLIFFLIIAYCLYLTRNETQNEIQNYSQPKKSWWKSASTVILFLVLIIFLWQYNLVPFQLNTHLNNADILVNLGKCDNAIALTEKYLQEHSILDSYYRMEYVNNLKTCAGINPDKNLEYTQKGVEALKEALKIQPLYTRFWIYLGSFTTILAQNEQNSETRQDLISQAYADFDKAEAISPRHTETLIERMRTDLSTQNYQLMEQNSEKCLTISPDHGDCYWIKVLAEIYLNEFDQADKDFSIAEQKNFVGTSLWSLMALANAYIDSQDYQHLAQVYEMIINAMPEVAQYRAELALAYSKLGQYQKAREQALIFFQMVPSEKAEANAFLQTLPAGYNMQIK